MSFVKPKKKWGKALWAKSKDPIFVAQQKRLRPENSAAGGIKARSQPETVRMAVYNAIRELFLRAHPFCEAHEILNLEMRYSIYREKSSQVHHKRGRDGLLLFDVRHWLAVCQECHDWIGNNVAKAQEFGLLAKGSEWRKQETETQTETKGQTDDSAT